MVIKGDLCILACGKLHPLRAAIRAWLVGVYEEVHADNLHVIRVYIIYSVLCIQMPGYVVYRIYMIVQYNSLLYSTVWKYNQA